jgi:hypothetical protein
MLLQHTEFKDGVPGVQSGVALPADHLVTVVLLCQQPEEQEHIMTWQASIIYFYCQ